MTDFSPHFSFEPPVTAAPGSRAVPTGFHALATQPQRPRLPEFLLADPGTRLLTAYALELWLPQERPVGNAERSALVPEVRRIAENFARGKTEAVLLAFGEWHREPAGTKPRSFAPEQRSPHARQFPTDWVVESVPLAISGSLGFLTIIPMAIDLDPDDAPSDWAALLTAARAHPWISEIGHPESFEHDGFVFYFAVPRPLVPFSEDFETFAEGHFRWEHLRFYPNRLFLLEDFEGLPAGPLATSSYLRMRPLRLNAFATFEDAPEGEIDDLSELKVHRSGAWEGVLHG